MSAHPARQSTPGIALVAMLASVGLATCTYDFDKFSMVRDTSSSGTGGSPGLDASTTGGSTGTDALSADTAASCGGASYGEICWYLGPEGESCQQVCTSHGEPAPEAPSYVGSLVQGGTLTECAVLFALLRVSGTPTLGTRLDGRGFGCHIYQDGSLHWLALTDFSVTESEQGIRLVCGCTR
jgi:hypothetical protein